MASDRTNEFLSLAQSLPSAAESSIAPLLGSSHTPSTSSFVGATTTTTNSTKAARSAPPTPAYAALREFHQTAGDISRDIASTSALLAELTTLVRHQSMLQDDSAPVNNLVVRIKTSIENLHSRLDQASRVLQTQKRQLGKHSQAGQEATNLVDGLQAEFAQAATGFKRVLQQRTDNLKETDDRQRQVYGNDDHDGFHDDPMPDMGLLAAPPPVYGDASNPHASFMLDLTSNLQQQTGGEPTSSSLPRPHGIAAPGSGGLEYGVRQRKLGNAGTPDAANFYGHTGPLTPLDIQRMEEESGLTQSLQLIPDQDYMQQRADAMSTVETNIVELGTIFNKLAVMVSEHQEMVQRVEDNVEDANTNISLSLETLTDTLTNLRSNRQLMLRLFSVLVVFIIVFVIGFA